MVVSRGGVVVERGERVVERRRERRVMWWWWGRDGGVKGVSEAMKWAWLVG